MTNPFSYIGLGVMANQAYYGTGGQLQNAGAGSQYLAQQAQQAQAFNQYAQQEIERKDWMIDGVRMTFQEFADTLYPEDTAERTMFFLKYSK